MKVSLAHELCEHMSYKYAAAQPLLGWYISKYLIIKWVVVSWFKDIETYWSSSSNGNHDDMFFMLHDGL